MNKKQTTKLILDFLLAIVFFGGVGWIFELIDGRTDASVGHFFVRGLVFAVIVVPLNFWLRKRKKKEDAK